jgi:multiple sugar transport system substrate-binding protein
MQGLYFSHASRLSRVVAGLLGLVLCLGGCGVKNQGSGAATTLSVWYSTDDPVERAWSQQLARRFERSHPDIRIQLTDYSFEDMNTKLQLALSAGNPPDLAYVTPRGPGIPAYVGAHTFPPAVRAPGLVQPTLRVLWSEARERGGSADGSGRGWRAL